MSNCHDLLLNDVYECPDCGLQLKIIKECRDSGEPVDECCGTKENCALICCGHELVKRPAAHAMA